MIILTGSKGFIGQNFLKYLMEHSDEEIVTVNEDICWDWLAYFESWEKVSLINTPRSNLRHDRKRYR